MVRSKANRRVPVRLIARVFAAACLAFAVPSAASAQLVDLMRLMAPGTLPEKAMGEPGAPVTIVEYASLTCSHCGNFYRTTFPELKSKYIDTGKVRFVLREFPLDELALVAAMAARCAPEDRYFDVIHTLFNDQAKWAFVEKPGDALLAVLQPHGFTDESFKACLADEPLVRGIIDTSNRGQELGVGGTPAFFINGQAHGGAMTIADFDAIIEPLLTSSTPAPAEAPASE